MAHAGDGRQAMAEAEVKVRLTAEECARVTETLAALGFTFAGESALTDYYLDFARSPLKGYDFTRLRIDGGQCLLTEKHWIRDAAGQAVRLEDEREITREEAGRLLAGATPRTLHKIRREFHGTIQDHPASIVLDTLELAGATLYFLECEMLVPPDQGSQAREDIQNWMRGHLPISDLSEAPSMLELLLAYDG